MRGATGYARDWGQLSAWLRDRVDDIVRELLPAARIDGPLWRVGSVAGEPGQSLKVERFGPRRGLWHDFSSASDAKGDILDLVAQVKFGGRLALAADWARARRGGSPGDWPTPAPRPRQAPEPDNISPNQAALKIWHAAKPLQPDDPVWCYLDGRGIDLGLLPRQPRALRYHPRLWHAPSQSYWPAMVAVICDAQGNNTAIHRTYLDELSALEPEERQRASVRKAPVGDNKMSLGRYKGGCIRLGRGRTNRPWSRMHDGEILLLGEGIEDVLAGMLRFPDWRAAAGVSLSAMLSLVLPPQIRTVALLRQADPPGSPAAALVERVMARWDKEGRRVMEWQVPVFVKDIAQLTEKLRAWGT